MDDQSNPHASPIRAPAAPERRQPIGTVILTVLLFFIGVSLCGAGVTGFLKHAPANGWPTNPHIWSLSALFEIMGLSAFAAAIGLMSGRGWGWWAAVAWCYVTGAFVLLPLVRNGIDERTWKTAFYSAVLLAYWLYLHRRNVLAYFAPTPRRRWPMHIGLFTLAAAVVLAIWMR